MVLTMSIKTKRHVAVPALTLALLCFGAGTSGGGAYRIPVQINEIVAYNRLEVKSRKGSMTVRLIGVYLPGKNKVTGMMNRYAIPQKHRREIYVQRIRGESFLSRSLSPGDTMYIEPGMKKRDRYGNRLVYLYMPNRTMLNGQFIRQGYSFPYTSVDNIKYREWFLELLKQALREKRGLWRLWSEFHLSDISPVARRSVTRADDRENSLTDRREISVMTFNVENLFDDRHEPGKNDYGFLPMSYKKKYGLDDFCREKHEERMIRSIKKCRTVDWNSRTVSAKMRRVAGTVLSYNRGRGPDILVLQEVENFSVLDELRTKYLAPGRYLSAVLIEGEDFRGIDVAMLSRLPVSGGPVLHPMPYSDTKKTRGILQAQFRLPGGSTVTVFGFHFPSQASSVTYRLKAFRFLNSLRGKLPGDEIVIAAGDCNVTETENTENRIFNGLIGNRWLVSRALTDPDQNGTVYSSWKKSWAFFDVILFSRNLGVDARKPAPWMLVPGSIRVWDSNPGHRTGNGRPKRFNPYSHAGVSDHWPVVARITLRD